VTKADIPRLVEIATADICHQTNPRKCRARSDFAALFATEPSEARTPMLEGRHLRVVPAMPTSRARCFRG
jgi:hypothetical protein